MPQLPSEQIKLPNKKKDLALAIDRHANREVTRAMPMYTLWRLADFYMQGYRRFDTFNPETGQVQAYITDDKGRLGFQSQKLLVMINEVSDAMAMMDVRPSVSRSDDSLASIKDRSVAQILSDAITPEHALERVKRDFMYLFTTYGFSGLTGDVSSSQDMGMTSSYTAIHPRELFPFPSTSGDHTSEQGIMRQRMVPLDVLVDKLGSKVKSNKAMDMLDYYETEVGDAYHNPFSYGNEEGNLWQTMHDAFDGTSSPIGTRKKSDNTVAIVRVREIWMHGPRGTTKRYASASGEYLFEDVDYGTNPRPQTIGYGRFLNNGNWHGAGLFHVLFSMHRSMEKLLRDLYQNIHDIDRYGLLVLPGGEFNERNLLREIPGGPKAITYTQDSSYDQNQFRPFHVEPFTAGEIPGKTALMADGLLRQLNPITDIAASKGRVDSASGLRMLEEEGRRKLDRPLKEAAGAFSTVHKYLTGKAIFESMSTQQPFPVNRLTTDMAGAVIDFEKQTISLNENVLPKIHRLTFTVRDEAPRNVEARKQNAFQIAKDYFAENGYVDVDGLKLYLISEGMDTEAWLEEEKNAYQSIVRNILMLYGDGEQNEQIVVSPHMSKPALQLRVLNAFMGSVEFTRAGVNVQNDFVQYRQELMAYSGNVLNGSMKNPDDYVMAAMQQEQMAGMPSPMGPEAGPPPIPFPGAQSG